MTHKHTIEDGLQQVIDSQKQTIDALLKKHEAIQEQRDELANILDRALWFLEVTFDDKARIDKTQIYIDAVSTLKKTRGEV